MADFLTENSGFIAQIFGFAAMAAAILSYQFRRHKTIMISMIICSFLWCLHYTFLGLFTPVMMNFVNVLRNFVYSFRDRKWAQSKLIPAFFMLLSTVLTLLTWDSLWCILPLIAAYFVTFANWQTDTKLLKYLTVPVCICWFTYNFANHSYAGTINEALTLFSIIISLLRIRKSEKKTV